MEKRLEKAVVEGESLTPYEEVNLLNEQLEEIKEVTLKGTDLEYFSEEQLQTLNKLTNELAALTFQMITAKQEEK